MNANKTKTCIQSHLRKINSAFQGMYPKLMKEIKLFLRIFEKISCICLIKTNNNNNNKKKRVKGSQHTVDGIKEEKQNNQK